jgi:hypothetical protein
VGFVTQTFLSHPDLFLSSRPYFCHPGLEPGSIACRGYLQWAAPCNGSRVFARDDKKFMDVSTSPVVSTSSGWINKLK